MGMAKYRADLGKVVGIGRVGGLGGFGEGFGVPLWATVGMSSSPRTHVAFMGLPSPPNSNGISHLRIAKFHIRA